MKRNFIFKSLEESYLWLYITDTKKNPTELQEAYLAVDNLLGASFSLLYSRLL